MMHGTYDASIPQGSVIGTVQLSKFMSFDNHLLQKFWQFVGRQPLRACLHSLNKHYKRTYIVHNLHYAYILYYRNDNSEPGAQCSGTCSVY